MYKYVYEFLIGSEVTNSESFQGKASFGNLNSDINSILNSSFINYEKKVDSNSGESR